MANHKKTYEKFLFSSLGRELELGFPKLDSMEEYVLKMLGACWHRNEKTKVVEIIHSSSKVSSSTMFRYVKRLRQKGYLYLLNDEFDGRIKYVEPTNLTSEYFISLGELMTTAIG